MLAVRFNTIYYYYVRNGQGDIIKLIDGDGNTVVEYVYDSWGKQISCTGTLASTLGKYNPFRYRGYVYDTESGFYYLKTRYYDPSIGRFISSDLYLSTGQGVIGNNSYTYCLNDPANCIDNTGKLANTNVMEADGGGGDIRDEISNYGPYDNSDAAAFEVAPYLYNMTKRTNQEYMAIIYSITNNGKENYYLSRIYRGDHDNVIVPFIFNVIVLSYSSYVSKGTIKIQGIVHSHPYCNGHIYNEYSGLIGDEGAALIAGSCYLVEPKLKGLYRIDRKNVINSYVYGYSISSNMELYKIGTIYGLPDYKEKYKCR